MIHPSYYELMEKINRDDSIEDTPVITSRYSLVLATSKRARQLTNGAEPKVKVASTKMLSIAVDEFYQGVVHIVSEETADEPGEEAPAEEPVAVEA